MRSRGVTLIEALTLIVALVVLGAVAIPLWRTHDLRLRRTEAIKALLEIQTAQDRAFGENARYAGSEELPMTPASAHYRYEIERSADQLSYVATAHAVKVPGSTFDSRCARLSIDQHGRRFATNEAGEDSTADCWSRK
jgi:type IV pilus assembly protein PilE